MKKIISLLLAFAFLFALAGCSNTAVSSQAQTEPQTEKAAAAEETKSETETKSESTSKGGKSLVVFFSRAGEQYGVGVIEKGNTAIVADVIAEQTGADSFEILPKEDNYPTTYSALTDYAKQEQNSGARPEIKSTVENFDSYDTIYLGYPIWWGDLPMICYTFLEGYDFSGKTVIPFCTHAGSGDAGTQSKIQSAIPGAQVKEVLAIAGTEAQNNRDSVKTAVTDWLGK